MGSRMQKAKRYNTKKFISELVPLVGMSNVEFRKTKITAIVPIRKESGRSKYTLKIVINNYGYCQVYIIEPKIKKHNGCDPPHIYKNLSRWNDYDQQYEELRLCLYLPDAHEYSPRYRLIETIIAWAIKWTEFYELWLLTGEWFGGGMHPTIKNCNQEKSIIKHDSCE